MNPKSRRAGPKTLPIEPGRRPTSRATFTAWLTLTIQALNTAIPVYRRRPLPQESLGYAAAKALDTWTNNAAAFVSPTHLLHWLRRAAYWHAVEGFRRALRRREQALDGVTAEAFIGPKAAKAPRQRWSPEDQEAAWAAIQDLMPLDRFLIEGRYYDRLTDRAMAKVLFNTPSPSAAQALRVWRRRKGAEARLRPLLERRGIAA